MVGENYVGLGDVSNGLKFMDGKDGNIRKSKEDRIIMFP
jgi:hypothetical protein